jgi:hypothetical protein
MSPLDALMEAKAARDMIRATVVKTLRRPHSQEEIGGLLRADDLATANLEIAQASYDTLPALVQIHDSQPLH